MTEFYYDDNEFIKRKDLLGEIGSYFKSYMEKYANIAAVQLLPSVTLAQRYDIRPKMASIAEWQKMHSDLALSMPDYVKQINEQEKERLGDRLIRCRVSDNPVSSWEARESTRDMHTGMKRGGAEKQGITVMFSFPYTPKMR